MRSSRWVFLAWLFVGVPSAVMAAGGADPIECPDYASKLESCSPYSCTFTHPVIGTKLERTIVCMTAGVCATVEAMPGASRMRCEFPPEVRRAVAAFVRRSQAAERDGKSISGTLSSGRGGATASTSIDGTPVVNPLQQALENGTCKIGKD